MRNKEKIIKKKTLIIISSIFVIGLFFGTAINPALADPVATKKEEKVTPDNDSEDLDRLIKEIEAAFEESKKEATITSSSKEDKSSEISSESVETKVKEEPIISNDKSKEETQSDSETSSDSIEPVIKPKEEPIISDAKSEEDPASDPYVIESNKDESKEEEKAGPIYKKESEEDKQKVISIEKEQKKSLPAKEKEELIKPKEKEELSLDSDMIISKSDETTIEVMIDLDQDGKKEKVLLTVPESKYVPFVEKLLNNMLSQESEECYLCSINDKANAISSSVSSLEKDEYIEFIDKGVDIEFKQNIQSSNGVINFNKLYGEDEKSSSQDSWSELAETEDNPDLKNVYQEYSSFELTSNHELLNGGGGTSTTNLGDDVGHCLTCLAIAASMIVEYVLIPVVGKVLGILVQTGLTLVELIADSVPVIQAIASAVTFINSKINDFADGVTQDKINNFIDKYPRLKSSFLSQDGAAETISSMIKFYTKFLLGDIIVSGISSGVSALGEFGLAIFKAVIKVITTAVDLGFTSIVSFLSIKPIKWALITAAVFGVVFIIKNDMIKKGWNAFIEFCKDGLGKGINQEMAAQTASSYYFSSSETAQQSSTSASSSSSDSSSSSTDTGNNNADNNDAGNSNTGNNNAGDGEESAPQGPDDDDQQSAPQGPDEGDDDNEDEDESLYSLSVTIDGGDDSYTPTVTPSSGSYEPGTEITITATPEDKFTGWSGDASGSNNVITVIMDEDKDIEANFATGLNPPLW